jgi:hypothetical protein
VKVRTVWIDRRVPVPGRPHELTVAHAGTVVATLWHDARIAIVRPERDLTSSTWAERRTT